MSCCHESPLTPEDERDYVPSLEHSNCVRCLVRDKGSLTQEEVGYLLDISKEAVHQCEKQALRKFKKKMKLCFPELVSNLNFAHGASEIENVILT